MSEARKEFKVLPENTYNLKVTGAEVKESKNTSGCFYLSTEFTVVNGDHEGMKLWDNYILVHPDAAAKPKGAGMAVSIGTTNVDKLLQAAGTDGYGSLDGQILSIPNLIEGKEVTAKVYQQTQKSNNPKYDGRVSNKAKDFQRGF